MAHRWYVVHVYSGFEKTVQKMILEKAAKAGLEDKFEEVLIPVEEVVEARRGKNVKSERKFFPGYVLVKMDLSDTTWHMVQDIPKVTGFLGAANKPQPISQKEAERILQQMQEGAEKPRHAVAYEVGEKVKVIDGPFNSFAAVVEDVDADKGRLRVSVSIFGRATPVELEFSQVEKSA